MGIDVLRPVNYIIMNIMLINFIKNPAEFLVYRKNGDCLLNEFNFKQKPGKKVIHLYTMYITFCIYSALRNIFQGNYLLWI